MIRADAELQIYLTRVVKFHLVSVNEIRRRVLWEGVIAFFREIVSTNKVWSLGQRRKIRYYIFTFSIDNGFFEHRKVF